MLGALDISSRVSAIVILENVSNLIPVKLELRTLLKYMRYAGLRGQLSHHDDLKSSDTIRTKQEQRSSNRLTEFINQMRKSRGSHVRLKIDARIICKRSARDIIILDVDRETILTIPSYGNHDSIELIYNPPCPLYPGGHFDVYNRGEIFKVSSGYTDDDYDLFHIAVAAWDSNQGQRELKKYIDAHPSDNGKLLTSGRHAYQLKRGRALLRLDMNHPTRQMNQCEYVGLDSSHLSSCIEQALICVNVSQLANVMAKYESESRSADENSPEHGTELMTSSLSRDAFKLLLFSGSSPEAEIYCRLVVERINDGDISTTLKLCYIGHQILFCRDTININRPISDAQTLRDTFEQMLKIESYEQERSKFLSICNIFFRVLEPQGLMNIEQKELLREWISTRQYANTEDPIVSLVIEKCSEPKKKEEEKKWQEAAKMREEKEKEEKRKWQEEMMKKIKEGKEAERKLQETKKMRYD